MGYRRSWSLPALAGGLFLLAGAAAPAAAQVPSTATPPADSASSPVAFDGQAVDAAGKAVRGLEVNLHRVDAAGGARVASAVTDSVGRFHFEVSQPAPGGVLFAAARYEGELYVGPPLRGQIPQGGEYTLVVGSPATSATAMMGGAGGGAAGPGPGTAAIVDPATARRRASRFWTGLIGVATVGLAALFALRVRGGPGVPEPRRLLMELAAVEERIDALRVLPEGPARESHLQRYEALRRRLRRRALGDASPESVEADAAG